MRQHSALVFVLLGLLPQSSAEDCAPGDETVSLLQVRLRLNATPPAAPPAPAAPGPEVYPAERLWGLTAPEALSAPSAGANCTFKAGEGLPHSGWAFGACPQVVRSPEVFRLDIGVAAIEDYDMPSRMIPGFNPSIVRLPGHLAEFFPEGRWLAAFRSGPQKCPWSNFFRLNLKYRTFLAVLDGSFKTLTTAVVVVQNADLFEAAAVNDARLFARRDGSLFVSFLPYSLGDRGSPHSDNMTSESGWWEQELVAALHVSALRHASEPPVLNAHVDRLATELIAECQENGVPVPGPKKNAGLFEHDGDAFALDWIGPPTSVGPLPVQHIKATNSSEPMQTLCFESLPSDRNSTSTIDPLEVSGLQFHNGPSPIWIEEAHLYLGLAHITRTVEKEDHDAALIHADNYTHVFFALSGAPPFQVQSASHEFCFESQQRSGTCERRQFGSSLSRMADKLYAGYGVEDCESYVAAFSLKDTLQLLRPLVKGFAPAVAD